MKIAKLQKGFLLPAAIFIVVVLAALGAYAVNINTALQSTSLQDVKGARAYHMARTGVERGAYLIMQTSPDRTLIPSCFTSPTNITLDGFAVAISCTKYGNYFEQSSDHTIGVYQITSTASFGTKGTANYVERQIQITLSKCRGTDASSPYQCN